MVQFFPFSETILPCAQEPLLLHKSFRENPFDFLKVANEEALLIHVVGVLRLYAVALLVNLLPQNGEILAI
jgi:hypothetical protein